MKDSMIVGVPKESFPGERRVALIPVVVPSLLKEGLGVAVESGAGIEAGHADAEYRECGATVLPSRGDVFANADIVAQVLGVGANDPTGEADLALMRRGQFLVAFLRPLGSLAVVEKLASTGVTSFAIELIPRTTRAQAMDALSSMATICGYKAVLAAADALPRLFPMMTTAAGTITPARVLVVGAGVAGLQAIATARRLGAVVSAYDIRPAAREEVHSLGARFVDLSLEAAGAQDARGYARAQDEGFYRRQRELLGASSLKATSSSRRRSCRGNRPRCSSRARWWPEWPAGRSSSISRRSAAATVSSPGRTRSSWSMASRLTARSISRAGCRFTRARCTRAT
jgi:H+-translocating NAD(P) transhydrogenase subunit alpha